MNAEIRRAAAMSEEELYAYAKDLQAPYHLLKETARLKRLPVVNFAAGGVASPGGGCYSCYSTGRVINISSNLS